MPNSTREPRQLDRKARMKIPFTPLGLRPANERIQDFEDIVIPLTPQEAIAAATRCIHCPDPAPCFKACPAKNDISEALWLIEEGKFVEAARLYRQTNSLPESCGRVCPHENLCEGACVRNKQHEPVLCGALEAFVAAYEQREVGVKLPVASSTGKKVAIIGGGPAGLSCAGQLVQLGHHVTIFEKQPAAGGLLTYGIPNFKLPKTVVFAGMDDLLRAGVEFKGKTTIGKDKTIDDLFAEGYEAVFIGVGTLVDASMKTPGDDLPGVNQATPFLIRTNVDPAILLPEMRQPVEVGKKIVVIGGGDTASDCLRTALRLGAEEVTDLYRRTEAEMPGGPKDRDLARQEGAQYQLLTQPVRFIAGKDGHLAQVECVRSKLGEPDESGRRRPILIEGSNFIVEADTAILALGYWPDPIIGETTPGLETDKWGQIKVSDPETGETSRKGVYAGGDVVTGPDKVVTAMAAGRKSAAAMHKYLMED